MSIVFSNVIIYIYRMTFDAGQLCIFSRQQIFTSTVYYKELSQSEPFAFILIYKPMHVLKITLSSNAPILLNSISHSLSTTRASMYHLIFNCRMCKTKIFLRMFMNFFWMNSVVMTSESNTIIQRSNAEYGVLPILTIFWYSKDRIYCDFLELSIAITVLQCFLLVYRIPFYLIRSF